MSPGGHQPQPVLPLEQGLPGGWEERLSGDTVREANTDEVTGLKRENGDLKQAVAELYLRNDWLKKSLTGQDVMLDED